MKPNQNKQFPTTYCKPARPYKVLKKKKKKRNSVGFVVKQLACCLILTLYPPNVHPLAPPVFFSESHPRRD